MAGSGRGRSGGRRAARGVGAALATLALLAASCGDSSPPSTVVPTVPPTSADPATPTTTSTIMATTATMATTAPSRSTAPPPARGAVQVGICIVGVGPDGAWLQTAAALEPYQPFPDIYRTVVGDMLVDTVDGIVQTDVDEDFAEFSFTDGAVLGWVEHSGGDRFAADLKVGGNWVAAPRRISATDSASATYESFTAAVLADLGIAGEPSNRLVLRLDVEGDGKEEVLVIASSVIGDEPFGSEPENPAYTVVYLRRLNAADEVETTVIAQSAAEDAFSVIKYDVGGVFDANGDGDLEVVLDWFAFESGGRELYEFDGTTYTFVAGCGRGV